MYKKMTADGSWNVERCWDEKEPYITIQLIVIIHKPPQIIASTNMTSSVGLSYQRKGEG
jgi:hypothetical protein